MRDRGTDRVRPAARGVHKPSPSALADMLVGICQRLVRPGSLGMSRCWRPCSRKANVGRPGPGPSMPSTIDDATGWIPRGAAIRRYCLDDADLDGLEHIEKVARGRYRSVSIRTAVLTPARFRSRTRTCRRTRT